MKHNNKTKRQLFELRRSDGRQMIIELFDTLYPQLKEQNYEGTPFVGDTLADAGHTDLGLRSAKK